jgi:hypothetical protein
MLLALILTAERPPPDGTQVTPSVYQDEVAYKGTVVDWHP